MATLGSFEVDASGPKFDNVFIGIAGLIGAGKSTLATKLGKHLNLPVFYEPVKDNEYLADFYKDMKAHAFPMQVYLLNRRFAQHQHIIWSGKGAVQDRTIYEDSVFARVLLDGGHMERRDYETYISLFNHMANFMRKPNIIVYLHVTPEESLERIRLRNRDIESSISLEYLRALYSAYEAFIADISRIIPVIKVDYRRFRSAEVMARAIAREYARIHNIRTVTFEALESIGVHGSPESKSPEGEKSPTMLRVARWEEEEEDGEEGAGGEGEEGEGGEDGTAVKVAEAIAGAGLVEEA